MFETKDSIHIDRFFGFLGAIAKNFYEDTKTARVTTMLTQ